MQKGDSFQHQETGSGAERISQGSKDKMWLYSGNLMNPQGNEWNPLYLKKNEDHITGNGHTWMTQHNLFHNFIPTPQAMKNPDAPGAADKE